MLNLRFSILACAYIIQYGCECPYRQGQRITRSSAYVRWLIMVFPTIQPVPQLFSSFDRSSTWIFQRKGDNMLPCLTPLLTLNGADIELPHFTYIDWWAYQKAKILIDIWEPLCCAICRIASHDLHDKGLRGINNTHTFFGIMPVIQI